MAARLPRVLAFMVMVTTFGCARAVTVGSDDPSLNYSIEVRNDTPVAMIVSYNDGRADALLGTVQPGGLERFIIASPASASITVTAASQTGSRRSGPHSVTLGAARPLVILR